MKRANYTFVILLACCSCSSLLLGDEPSNSYSTIFEEFWKDVDNTWPGFETKHINWDSLYTVYRPQVTGSTTNDRLLNILTGLLYSLKDSHTNIFPKNSLPISYYPPHPKNFYGIGWMVKFYIPNYKANKAIVYKLINPDIGYIFISTFEDSNDQYGIIDQILNEFNNAKGIIIDVRGNTGGNSTNSAIIASRFTDQEKVYAYAKFRNGQPGHAMGDFVSEIISPSGSTQFLRKVAILTNRYSFSACEDFTLMMKSFSNVIHLGDSTGGGSETRPIFMELPGGWYCRVASKLLCDLNHQPISKGIAPDVYVTTQRADSLNNKDTIIEYAIKELTR